MISIAFLRQFRIGQFTIFDTLLAYIGVLILSPMLTWLVLRLHIKIPMISWLWFTLPLSVIFHIIFRQSTPVIKILEDPKNVQFYFTIIILLFMIYMGVRKIRKIRVL